MVFKENAMPAWYDQKPIPGQHWSSPIARFSL